MKKRSLKRSESLLEFESLWLGKRLHRERLSKNGGFWQIQDGKISHGSRTVCALSPTQKKKLQNLARRFRKVLNAFDTVKVVWIHKNKIVSSRKLSQKAWYFEVKKGDDSWTLLLPVSDPSSEAEPLIRRLKDWASTISTYLHLPLAVGQLKAEHLVLSPQAFGCLVHELVGHASENPNFKAPRNLKTYLNVTDSPGSADQWGFCPFDDMGTAGKKSVLLKAKTGKIRPLSSRNGNLRATSWNWHPIVRQRCLEIEAQEDLTPPVSNFQIHLHEVEMGSYCEDTLIAELKSKRATLESSRGNVFRLPPICIRASLDCLEHLVPFGPRETTNPAGGCHKDLQRGLPVSFTAPSAWIPFSRKTARFFEVSLF